MSNALALAAVSAALAAIVDEAAQAALTGVSVNVETQRPDRIDAADGRAGVAVFLYQVSPNPAWRNEDLATRGADGRLQRRPQTALDLHYLLTFYGEERTQQPERLLGGVASALHGRPLLTRRRIEEVIAAHGHLAGSDLARQVEKVRFVPMALNLEELSKLWSVFFQTAYRLSAAYQASVVLIESQESAAAALPVARRLLYVDTLKRPLLSAVRAEEGAEEPVLAGGRLVLEGRNLRGALTLVSVGGVPAAPQPADLTDGRISISLTSPPFAAGVLRAGLLGVQVVHQRLLGPPGQETAHRGVESNVLPLLLRPAIRESGGGPDIVQGTSAGPDPVPILTVGAEPPAGRDQRIVLLLHGPAGSHALPARQRAADGDALVFAIPEVAPGTYLVRLQVDGAEGLLARNAQGEYVGPTFTVAA